MVYGGCERSVVYCVVPDWGCWRCAGIGRMLDVGVVGRYDVRVTLLWHTVDVL